MKKALSILFSIFVAIVIVGIALFLTLYNKPEPNDNKENVNNSNNTTYAETLTLTCPREIILNLYDELHLNDDVLYVLPAEAKSNVQIEITKSSSTGIVGLTFENNVIKALSPGYYSIKFSAPRDSKGFLTDNLVVHVVDDDNTIDRVTYIKQELEVGKSFNISDLFNFEKASTKYSLSVDDESVVSLSNGKINIIKEGTAQIVVSIIEDYGFFKYYFTLNTVKNNYHIEIDEICRASYDLRVTYAIINNELGGVSQDIVATILEQDIATVTRINAPFIYIRPKTFTGIIHLSITFVPKNITKIVEINLSDYFT